MIRTMMLAAVAAMTLAGAGQAAPQKPRPAAPPAPVAPPAPPKPVVYVVEALRIGPVEPDMIERLKPIHTLFEIEMLLKATGTPFAWRKLDLDTANLPPGVSASLAGLPPNEPFVLPQKDGGLMMAVILGKR